MVPEEAPPVPWLCTTALSAKDSPGPSTSGCATGDRTTRSDCAAALTVTSNRWVAERPPVSVAVTVMVAVPTRSPLMVTVLPDALTVTLAVLEEVALCMRSSPSGSPK